MTKYDFTFLLENEGDLKEIKDLLKSSEGKIIEDKPWGKRTLEYPINKATDAYFFSWLIEMTGTGLSDFKKKLNYHEKLLRYLLLKAE